MLPVGVVLNKRGQGLTPPHLRHVKRKDEDEKGINPSPFVSWSKRRMRRGVTPPVGVATKGRMTRGVTVIPSPLALC